MMETIGLLYYGKRPGTRERTRFILMEDENRKFNVALALAKYILLVASMRR